MSSEGRDGLSEYERLKRGFSTSSSMIDGSSKELPKLTKAAGLGRYLAYAAANNPALRADFERWKATLERIPQVRALPNPQLRYGFFVREIETRVGPQRNKFGLSQMIPWPQKLTTNGEIAVQNSEAARQRFEDRRQALFYQVRLSYCDLYYLKKSIDITEQTIALVRYYERIARVRFRTAGGKHPDVIRAQLELGRLEDRLKTLKDWRRPMNASMNAALNRPSGAPLPWPLELEVGEPLDNEKALLDRLRGSNHELRALDSELRREEKSVERAQYEYLPDFNIGFDYLETARASASGVRDSGKDAVVFNFGVSLPIWLDKYSAGVKEARARKASIRSRRVARVRSLEAQFQRALFNFRDAERKINLYEKTLIPKAEQAQRATVTTFEAGKSDFLSLIDVERTLLEFQLNYEKARTDKARSQAHIERLLGVARETKR